MSDEPTEVDEPTILDSRFGVGDAETRFAEMGLPEGRPRRSRGRLVAILLVIAAGGLVMHQVTRQNDTEAQARREKRDQAERQLIQGLASGDLEEVRAALGQLGSQHPYQLLSNWLDRLTRADQDRRDGHHDRAYALLQEMPPVPGDLSVSARALVERRIRELAASLRQRRQWDRVDPTSLLSLREFLDQADKDSPYAREAHRLLDDLIRTRRVQITSTLEGLLVSEQWGILESTIAEAASGDPDFPVGDWLDRLNGARQSSRLMAEARRHLQAGRLLTASRLLPDTLPEEGPWTSFEMLSASLEALDSEMAEIQRAFQDFRQGRLEEALETLDEMPRDNAVISLIRSRWVEVRTLWERFHGHPLDSLEDQLAYVGLGRRLLERIPVDDGPFRDAVSVQLGVVQQDLDSYAGALLARLEVAWSSQDFTGSWNIASTLLQIRPEDPKAQETLARLNRVAATLVDDIYILRHADPELARERYDELSQLVPPEHPERRSADALISAK